MMNFVFVAIYFVDAFIVYFAIRKLKGQRITKAKCAVLSWIIATVIFLPLYWIVPDCIAPRYPTAEEAFRNSGKGEIIATAEGEQSAFVVYRHFSGALSTAVLPKDNKGYWNSSHVFFQKEKKSIVTEDGCRIFAVQFRNTSDLYLWGTGLASSKSIQLSNDNFIQPVEVTTSAAFKNYLFCTSVSDCSKTLSITIDDKNYPIF